MNDYDFEIKKGDYELAYIAEDNDPAQDSIVVVLTKTNNDQRVPKLLRFTQKEDGKWNKDPVAENEVINLPVPGRPWGCYILPNKAGVLLVLSK